MLHAPSYQAVILKVVDYTNFRTRISLGFDTYVERPVALILPSVSVLSGLSREQHLALFKSVVLLVGGKTVILEDVARQSDGFATVGCIRLPHLNNTPLSEVYERLREKNFDPRFVVLLLNGKVDGVAPYTN
jgi:hypothetical protein